LGTEPELGRFIERRSQQDVAMSLGDRRSQGDGDLDRREALAMPATGEPFDRLTDAAVRRDQPHAVEHPVEDRSQPIHWDLSDGR
jgi:hypothetical protein